MKPRQFSFALLIILTVSVGSVFAAKSAKDWLMRMSEAIRQNNYDGTFVYRHGDQLEAMRIVHRVNKGVSQERLVSLNGTAREIIRNNRDVICYLPDKRSVIAEHRKTNDKNFPALIPSQLDKLDVIYSFILGARERIAGRNTTSIIIKPRDRYRYGYQLWADNKTGLLLKSNLINNRGKIIEQFMFTNIDIGKPVRDADLRPSFSGKKWVWHRDTGNKEDDAKPGNWKAQRLPEGFMLTSRITRTMPVRNDNKVTEHLVYSDGLAAVSVFIKKQGASDSSMIGISGMGAINAYGAIVDDHQVTAVGEVPAATVSLIGQSVVRH